MICRDLRRSISRQGRMDMPAHIGAEPARGKRRLLLGRSYPLVLAWFSNLPGAADDRHDETIA